MIRDIGVQNMQEINASMERKTTYLGYGVDDIVELKREFDMSYEMKFWRAKEELEAIDREIDALSPLWELWRIVYPESQMWQSRQTNNL